MNIYNNNDNIAGAINIKKKLLTIKPTLGEWKENFRRKEEIVLSRIRRGHSRITHSYLLKGEVQTMCHICQPAYTIKHVLTECIDPAPTMEIFYSASNMKELYKNAKVDAIASFLKALKVYFLYDNCENKDIKILKLFTKMAWFGIKSPEKGWYA